MVWMKTAALPRFRKLHRIINGVDFKAGDRLRITTAAFFNQDDYTIDGEKHVVFTTLGSLGGNNSFLGGAFIFAGTLAITSGLWVLGFERCTQRRIPESLRKQIFPKKKTS